jgi:hypothetical protein
MSASLAKNAFEIFLTLLNPREVRRYLLLRKFDVESNIIQREVQAKSSSRIRERRDV